MAETELLKRLAQLDGLAGDEVLDSGVPGIRAVAVDVTGPHRVRVRYDDGRSAEADLEGLAWQSRSSAALRDPSVVAQVELVHDGAALRFGDDPQLEIGADLVLALAERQRPMSGDDFSRVDAPPRAQRERRRRRPGHRPPDGAGLQGRERRATSGGRSLPRLRRPTRRSCWPFTARAGRAGQPPREGADSLRPVAA